MGYRFDRFNTVGINEEATMGQHANSLRALREHGPRKGDPPRNRIVDPKTGRVHYANGWSKMREKYRLGLDVRIDEITAVLFQAAVEGDIQAIALALKPIINVSAIELSGADGAPINFIELARKAQEEKDD